MITLSPFQAPPRALGASARTVVGPPLAGILRSLPSLKKPMNFPSADQNGAYAPSVPASFSAEALSSLRIQIELLSLGPRAAKASSKCARVRLKTFWRRSC